MQRLPFILCSILLAIALSTTIGCKKDEPETPETEEQQEEPTPTAPVPTHIGRYLNEQPHLGYFEFFADGSAQYGTHPDNLVDGTYDMLSTHEIRVNISSFGAGNFETDFSKLHLYNGNVWVKQ